MAKVRPIIRDVWNSDDRAAHELATHERHKFAGPNAYTNATIPVANIAGTRISGSPAAGVINPASNAKYV